MRKEGSYFSGYADIKSAVEAAYGGLLRTLRTELPYKLPLSHPSWDLVSAILCAGLVFRTEEEVKGVKSYARRGDQVYDLEPGYGRKIHSEMTQNWFKNKYPMYCISEEILEQFLNTSLEGLDALVPGDWTPPVPGFLLLLPRGFELNGQKFIFLLVHFVSMSEGDGRTRHFIWVSLMNSETYVCMSKTEMGEGMRTFEEGKRALSKTEPDWIKSAVGIAIQSTMAISYLPELIEESTEGQGFRSKKPAQKTSDTRLPRWIGKNFTRQKRNPSTNPTPSGITMTTHWRRGHWRQQVCGEKWQQRKLQWIQPTLINP
jgi:hypothetical protein